MNALSIPLSPSEESSHDPALNFQDPQSRELLAYAQRVARSDATVLIQGETGTGKELLARHVHAASGRRGPFVAVNCGALVESLADAELFGHEAGAYTGAVTARAGWFEVARGGTLFLDEIGDMPLSLQVKLLRVLQERQVVRLGSRRAIPLNVRLLAATHVDLQQAVRDGHFREDLYYRLRVVSLALPPLRERPGDILPLARHFIRLHAPRIQVPPNLALSRQAEEALLAHAWPGNVRELENMVQFALIGTPGDGLGVDDFKFAQNDPWEVDGAEHNDEAALAAVSGALDAAMPRFYHLLDDILAQPTPGLFHAIEEAVVRAAYRRCGDNQVQAARLLGISRNTLRTLLRRHQVQPTTRAALQGL